MGCFGRTRDASSRQRPAILWLVWFSGVHLALFLFYVFFGLFVWNICWFNLEYLLGWFYSGCVWFVPLRIVVLRWTPLFVFCVGCFQDVGLILMVLSWKRRQWGCVVALMCMVAFFFCQFWVLFIVSLLIVYCLLSLFMILIVFVIGYCSVFGVYLLKPLLYVFIVYWSYCYFIVYCLLFGLFFLSNSRYIVYF